MAPVKSNDAVMGGTAESAIDRLRKQLRSDIKARFKGKMPVEWPTDFYDTRVLFYFAETFRKVYSLGRKDRVVVMEELKPTFSELESALESTARSLSRQVQGQDPGLTILNLMAAVKCWEKIRDINQTLEAVKSGEADEDLVKHFREFSVRLAREASIKRQSHAAVDEKQNGPELKGQAPAKQTDFQAPQPETRKQEVQQAQDQQKEPSQSRMRGDNTTECKKLTHAQLNARLRLSTDLGAVAPLIDINHSKDPL
ncbi:unnamed protein product [Clonostachys rosea f. rosea IK726]|uniref:Uncharacterized protein n=1 Tax=Clonostachys rosea f. rosea IK726 TaxID=1349383 RepID=A0ACA9TP15_BIOOC|nr:unnamed protein product [Clonostachys rosea f. rosea IK726]